MRWLLTVVGSSVLLSACAAGTVSSQMLKDGSYSITCELPMDDCVREVQDKCPNQRFRIVDGVSETRVRDVPPYEAKYHTSRLRLVCSKDGETVLLSLDAPKSTESETKAPAARIDSCTRGQTRECVGPAACRGGQVCLADGSGYGACDCGPVTPVAAAPPPTLAEPAPTSSPAPAPVPAAPSSASPAPVPPTP